MASLRLSELSNLTDDERARRIGDFYHEQLANPNGAADEVDRQISEFERRYEMSSVEMRRRIKSGEQRETAEICRWLMLLQLGARIGRPT